MPSLTLDQVNQLRPWLSHGSTPAALRDVLRRIVAEADAEFERQTLEEQEQEQETHQIDEDE